MSKENKISNDNKGNGDLAIVMGSDLPKGDWWCNDCESYINTVTYEEECVHCGSEDVEWHLEDGTVVR